MLGRKSGSNLGRFPYEKLLAIVVTESSKTPSVEFDFSVRGLRGFLGFTLCSSGISSWSETVSPRPFASRTRLRACFKNLSWSKNCADRPSMDFASSFSGAFRMYQFKMSFLNSETPALESCACLIQPSTRFMASSYNVTRSYFGIRFFLVSSDIIPPSKSRAFR